MKMLRFLMPAHLVFVNNQHADRKQERKTIWTILNAACIPNVASLTPERTKLLAARILRPDEIEPTEVQCQTVLNYARFFFASSEAKAQQVRNTIAGRIKEFKVGGKRGRQESEDEDTGNDGNA